MWNWRVILVAVVLVVVLLVVGVYATKFIKDYTILKARVEILEAAVGTMLADAMDINK